MLRTYSTCSYPGYQDTTTYAALSGDDDDDDGNYQGGGVGCGALLGAHCLALLLIHSGTDLEHLEFFLPSKYVEVGDD